MRKKIFISALIFLLFLTCKSIVSATTHQETTMVVTTQVDPIFPFSNPDFEWKVDVGELMLYTFTKIYDLNDYDEDGNQNAQTVSFIAENGSEIEMTIKEGSELLCEILALDEYPTIQMTLDGIKLEPSENIGSFVIKTTDNRTYWEEIAKQSSCEDRNITVEGDLVVYKSIDNWDDRTFYTITEFNWKTGWLSYIYQKESNDTHIITEMEATTGYAELTPGFEFSPYPVILVMFSIYILRRQRRSKET